MSAALQGPSGRIPLETTPLMIGYTVYNRLVVNDAQITAITAIVAASGQNYTITAVNSAHAVTLNGQRLVLQVAHELHPNDTVRIGEATFTYEESQPAPAPYTPAYPAYAETNPYGYEISNEAPIKAAPQITRNFQTDSVQPVAPMSPATPNLESPVYQGPVTPIPDSNVQWPQYQTTGNNLYSVPSAPSPSQPFMQPMGGMGTMPPAMGASAPVAPGQQNRSNLFKALLIALAVAIVLVAGGSGFLIYQLTRPQPIIVLSSQYVQDNVPVGAENSSLHIRGYKFSSNAPITFLLDNQPIMTGAANMHSDGSGNFQADLPITTAWSVGTHKLTAKDSAGYLTTNSDNVRIVNQGESGTPGPNGAPANSFSFTLNLNLKQTNGTGAPYTEILIVTGQRGSNSATVCDQQNDTGQPVTSSGAPQGGLPYTRTDTYACQGTYQTGKLSYTETLSSSKVDYGQGLSCQIAGPATIMQIQGSFSSATTLSGTYTAPGYAMPCTSGLTVPALTFSSTIGTWTGTIA